MYCFMPFYMRDLSIHRFGYLQGGVLEPVADGYQGIAVVKFLGVESYTWIFDCTGVGAPNPCAVPGSAVYGILKVELKELLME